MKDVLIKDFYIGENHPLAVISGPCVIESEEHALETAEQLVTIFKQFPHINFIYKSSYDKANRSAYSSFRGPGLKKGLEILDKIKRTFNIPVMTDVHAVEDTLAAASVCDILQIPAFLCRQTDLLEAAAETQVVINIKKGQFMAPWDMGNAVEKILKKGNERILLTDRGTTFGYNNLVTDLRSIPIMQSLGFPVCFDASHSVQLPGGKGTYTGGQREFILPLARAAVAAGCNCLYIESHPNPSLAKSDKETVYPFDALADFLKQVVAIYEIVHTVS